MSLFYFTGYMKINIIYLVKKKGDQNELSKIFVNML